MAAVTDSDWVVPASRGHGPCLCGAGAAYALSTGPAVVLGHGRGESLGAAVALRDVLVRNPVVGTSNVLHETCDSVNGIGRLSSSGTNRKTLKIVYMQIYTIKNKFKKNETTWVGGGAQFKQMGCEFGFQEKIKRCATGCYATDMRWMCTHRGDSPQLWRPCPM